MIRYSLRPDSGLKEVDHIFHFLFCVFLFSENPCMSKLSISINYMSRINTKLYHDKHHQPNKLCVLNGNTHRIYKTNYS